MKCHPCVLCGNEFTPRGSAMPSHATQSTDTHRACQSCESHRLPSWAWPLKFMPTCMLRSLLELAGGRLAHCLEPWKEGALSVCRGESGSEAVDGPWWLPARSLLPGGHQQGSLKQRAAIPGAQAVSPPSCLPCAETLAGLKGTARGTRLFAGRSPPGVCRAVSCGAAV